MYRLIMLLSSFAQKRLFAFFMSFRVFGCSLAYFDVQLPLRVSAFVTVYRCKGLRKTSFSNDLFIGFVFSPPYYLYIATNSFSAHSRISFISLRNYRICFASIVSFGADFDSYFWGFFSVDVQMLWLLLCVSVWLLLIFGSRHRVLNLYSILLPLCSHIL